MRELDAAAVLRGALVGAVLIVPGAILSRVVSGDDEVPALGIAAFLLLVVGFVLAGWAAGTQPAAERTPVQHGTVAAAAALVVVQVFAVLSRIAAGDSIRPVSIIANLLLAASCGAVGGLLAARSINRRLEGDPT